MDGLADNIFLAEGIPVASPGVSSGGFPGEDVMNYCRPPKRFHQVDKRT